LRSADNEVFGCEARVWLKAVWLADKLQLACDSESRTVLGLLQLLSSALQGASRDQVRQFDLEAYFHALGLADLITSSRRNGLRHVVQAIQASAYARLERASFCSSNATACMAKVAVTGIAAPKRVAQFMRILPAPGVCW